MPGKPSLQTVGTVAVAAGPGFRAVFVATTAPSVRVLHGEQIEILFPVRAFFFQWRGTKAGLDPSHTTVRKLARTGHVVQVFISGHRSSPEQSGADGAAQCRETSGLDPGGDKVSHALPKVIVGRIADLRRAPLRYSATVRES